MRLFAELWEALGAAARLRRVQHHMSPADHLWQHDSGRVRVRVREKEARETPFSPYVAPRFPHMSEMNSSFEEEEMGESRLFFFLWRVTRKRVWRVWGGVSHVTRKSV